MSEPAAVSRREFPAILFSPFAMVAVGLGIRLAVMAFTYTSQLDPAQDHWLFGCEMGRVARSIATGHGFSSPYIEPTGPTALLPPVYPFLLACIFKMFGVYTTASAIAILTFNNLCSSLTCLPIFGIARRIFGLQVARGAGWIWAIFPYSIILSDLWIWETVVTTFLLTVLVLTTLRLERSSSIATWLGYGLLWGVAALTNPAVLSSLPFLGAWICVRQWRRGKNCLPVAAAASLVFFAAIAPWVWRCSQTYGRFVALRANFGLEILVGNSADSSNPFNWKILPSAGVENNSAELTKLIQVGEPAYLTEKDLEARQLVEQNPGRYFVLTLRRILYTWTCFWNFDARPWADDSALPNVLFYSCISLLGLSGLVMAIRMHVDGIFPLAVLVVCFPLVYYLTHPEIRFRHPIDPEIVILAVFAVQSWRKRPQETSSGSVHFVAGS